MALFKIFKRSGQDVQANSNRITTSEDLSRWLEFMQGNDNDAGVIVTPEKALECQSVWTAVGLLAGLLAQLPVNVYREDGDNKEIAADHPLQALLSTHGMPNGFQNSFEFREYGTTHICLTGNAYWFINRVRGEVRELLPIDNKRVSVEQTERFEVIYKVTSTQGVIKEYAQKDILHVKGRSFNGYLGDNVVHRMRNHIALAMAQDSSAGKMFKHGALLLGALKKEGTLSDEAYERLKKQIEEQMTGLSNAYKPLLLEDGLTWEQMSQTAEQAQLLDSRKLQRSIVTAIWDVPPHLVGDLDKATFSNIENLARQFVDYVLMKWIRRWEEALMSQLMPVKERGIYKIKFGADGLLRGDAAARAAYYSKALGSGGHEPWMTVNEIRKKEDMPPVEGGDERKMPLTGQQKTGENNDSDSTAAA